jgi:sugar O-acyltransferase (sialic acid O-acetyltransferase NeuD family)
MSELVVYGAGGFAREVAQLVGDLARAGAPITLVGFLSDDPAVHGTTVAGLPVLGGREFLEAQSGRFDVAIGVGTPAVKRRLAAHVRAHARSCPALVHPTVVTSTSVMFGSGAIVCAGSILTVDVEVGDFVTINLACTVGHDSRLGDYVTLAPSVNVSGDVKVAEGTDVGTGSRIIQGQRLGHWSIIGAGAVVTTDIPDNCTAVGVPARPIKFREPEWQLQQRV